MTPPSFRSAARAVARTVRMAACAAVCCGLLLAPPFPETLMRADAAVEREPSPPGGPAGGLSASLAGRRFSATRPFGGDISEEEAAIVAETAARAAAMQGVVRALVVLPEVRIAGSVSPVPIKSPNLLALAHATVATSVLLVSKSRKNPSVTVTVAIEGDGDGPSLESRVREALVHPDRLSLYEAAVLREKALLAAFDSLTAGRGSGEKADQGPPAGLPDTAKGIVGEIQALDKFTALLPTRNGRWKNPEAVRAAMKEALEFAPESALCRNALGDALLQTGRSQEAMEQQTLALKSSPSFARAYHSRGAAALALALYSSAIADFSEAIRLAPENPAHYRARGMARHLAGETAAMCGDLYQACTLGECEEFQWAVFNNYCAPARHP